MIVATFLHGKAVECFSTCGLTPEPCLNSVPVTNQKLFDKLNALTKESGVRHGLGLTHSYGVNLAKANNVKLAIKKPPAADIHISKPKGFKNVKNVDSLSVGT